VLMLKVLVLQQLNSLSDDRIEYQIRDRLSFMRFLGMELEDPVPDAKTVWSFREQRKAFNLVNELFARFHEQLACHGYDARNGQMVDATFVEVPRQRNKGEENALIQEGAIPIEWGKDEHRLAQKDTDACWTKKNNTNYDGYKNHINADHETKLVRKYEVTDASVHDSQVFDELLDHTEDGDGNKRAVYADSAYRVKRHRREARQSLHRQPDMRKGNVCCHIDRRAEGSEQKEIEGARAGGACIWCAGCDGQTLRAHDRIAARQGESRDNESDVQHDTFCTDAQARYEDDRIGASAIEKMPRKVAVIARKMGLRSANLSERKKSVERLQRED
jgi:IS5 family transposase